MTPPLAARLQVEDHSVQIFASSRHSRHVWGRFLYIRDESSFDRFHANKDLLFRIEERIFNVDNPGAEDPFVRSAWLQAGLKHALKDELPEVSHATRFNAGYGNVLRYEDKLFRERLAAIAFVIAAPVAWYGVDQWLSAFSYRVTVGWELQATCMIAGLMIALATASFHAIKVSLKNPADTLRHE